MKNSLLKLRSKVLAGCFMLLLTWPVYSQEYASAAAPLTRASSMQVEQPGSFANGKSLSEVLATLGTAYQVSFNYDDDLIKDIILAENFTWSQQEKLEKVLTRLLPAVQLNYEKMDQRNYVIVPVKRKTNSQSSLAAPNQAASQSSEGVSGGDPILRSSNSHSQFAVITIHGTIVDETNQPMPGVNILVKGTANGTNTDGDGKFTLDVPDENAILVISFIGYSREEILVGDKTEFNVSLIPDLQSLEEVVVTALGVKKEKKALTASVTEVSGETFTKAREVNLGNALVGRIAGVNATSTATGPSGSSRVIIRGNGSLNGNNQPLYVVNGMPINNTNQGSAGTFGGIDRGDGLLSINPDDIETISVLKGGTAAALYGSRAANGVILITTKSGAAQKGIGVEYNTTYTWETPRDLTDWQYEYGSGSFGAAPTTKAEAIDNGRKSWGAPLNGAMVMQADGVARPYSAQKNNIKNFYDVGNTFTNTLSLTGGSEVANFRFSASNLDNNGIVPNNSLNRKTFNLSVNATLAKKIIFEGKAQYSNEEVNNRTFTADFQKNPNAGAQLIPTNVDVRILDPGYDDRNYEVLWNDYVYFTNPYFAVNRIRNGDTRRRFIGSFSTRYNITEALYVRGRVGIDQFNLDAFNIEPTGLAFNNTGSMTTDQNVNQEINAEVLAGFNKNVGVFSVNILAGGNKMKTQNAGLNLASGQLNVPFQYFIGNGKAQTFNKTFGETAINSLFGSADIGYKNILFLTVTGRNDWFSTLSVEDNSKFYPSVGAGFVFSDAFDQPAWLNYGKVRASWAQVGGGAPDPYAIALTYNAQPQQHLGATLMTINGTNIPNTLSPYTSTTTEFGIETRVFDSRVGLDVTLYDRSTTKDIVNASVPLSSGFSTVSLNVGEIQNRGIEVLLNGTPVKTEAFTWDASFNLAYNKNTVVKISDDLKSILLPGARTRTENGGIYHFEGQPFGMIAGNRIRRDANGNGVYTNAGIPVAGPLEPLGKGVPPWTLGFSNTFAYRNFLLSVLVDGKFGAQVYSATNAYATQFGLHKNTAANGVRENGVPVSGVNALGEPVNTTVSAQTYYSTIWSSITDQFVTDADFIKLRSITLGYNLPGSLLAKTPFQSATVSFVARNLFMLYNTADNIDPESSYANGNAQGLENFGVPTTRSYGFNLTVKL